ncbi:hypothetical protein ABKV19_000959 [Rosa sericea]
MPLSATVSPPTLSLFPQSQPPQQSQLHLPHNLTPFLKPKRLTPQFHCAKATRRNPNYPPGGADSFVDDPRNWSRSINSEIDRPYGFEDDDEDDEDGDDDDEEDRSLDLLVRFVQNVFKKVSKRARRAVRSVLPVAIPTKLVICTLGSLVFVSILLIRGIWIGVAYVQENRNHKVGNFEDEGRPWTGAQPAT